MSIPTIPPPLSGSSLAMNPEATTTGAYTSGNYATEAEAATDLDRIVTQSGLFRIHKEVSGTLIQPRPGQTAQGVRIDRILVPTDALTSLGWQHGIIGVEVKNSGKKLGPVIAQIIDYARAVYTLDAGFQVWPTYVLIWQAHHQGGDLASIFAQNRLGTASASDWARLSFYTGQEAILTIKRDGQVVVGSPRAGRKVGSR